MGRSIPPGGEVLQGNGSLIPTPLAPTRPRRRRARIGEQARRPRRGRRRRALTGSSAGRVPQIRVVTGDPAKPRVVVRPEIDDGAALARRTRDPTLPTRGSSIPTTLA